MGAYQVPFGIHCKYSATHRVVNNKVTLTKIGMELQKFSLHVSASTNGCYK